MTHDDIDEPAATEPGALAGHGEVRPRRTILWIAITVGLVAVGLIAILAAGEPAASRVTDSPLVGRPAPRLSGETVDGAAYQLQNDAGRWVVVNFFATWCVPCREEHDDLVRFSERHSAAGDASVVGVIYSDDAEAVRRFRKEKGGNWPMVMDPDGRIALDYGVGGVPESFLVAPDGTVVAKIVGGVRDSDLEVLLKRARGS